MGNGGGYLDQGGIAAAGMQEKVWKIKGVTNYGPNMVSFLLKIVWKHWYVVGAYIPPTNQPEVRKV